MNGAKVPIIGIALFLVVCTAGIFYMAINSSNNQAREDQLRVVACSHVQPSAVRGACVEGKPLEVTQTKTVTVVRWRKAPGDSITGLVNACRGYANNDENNANAAANGFGNCLAGIQKIQSRVGG